MEVIKAVGRQGSAAPNSVAIRADQKSYSYIQIISSAMKTSNLLNNSDIKAVSSSLTLITLKIAYPTLVHETSMLSWEEVWKFNKNVAIMLHQPLN